MTLAGLTGQAPLSRPGTGAMLEVNDLRIRFPTREQPAGTYPQPDQATEAALGPTTKIAHKIGTHKIGSHSAPKSGT